MSISQDQRAAILSLIGQGLLANEEIAVTVGVSTGTVAAVRANLTMGRYGVVLPESTALETESAGETVFSLEKDMQAAIRANISQLESGLEVSDGGKERVTGKNWRIDVTAKDSAGKTVLIELKAGVASPEALTQVMAYVGEVFLETGEMPRAILVAESFHPKVKAAAIAIPSLQLRRYRIRFVFDSADSPDA